MRQTEIAVDVQLAASGKRKKLEKFLFKYRVAGGAQGVEFHPRDRGGGFHPHSVNPFDLFVACS